MAIDALSIVAKLTLDSSGYDKELDKSSGKASSFGSKLKSGLGAAAKVAAGAITAAAGAVSVLVTKSVQGYAEYEQLVGGVETLYKTSADQVLQYAQNAYKTAGLSANEYMETATSFAASLVSSLGGDTAEAARMADMAITDMSDNANKMGTDMSAIQSAYQGFAKQNYTMLDNLKLGYGGTKTEMERLISDANDLKVAQGGMADLTIDSYADIVEAIHLVQDEMGITGTTAAEASTTISGSIGSMKAAWQNLLVGLADGNADIDSLINNVVTTAETAFGNIMPVITQTLQGIGQLVQKIAPIIAEKLPSVVSEVLPSLLSAATDLINGVVAALPTLIQVLADQAPMIVETLVEGLVANLPAIIDAGIQLIGGLIKGIISSIPALLKGILEAAGALLDAILGFFGIHSPSTVMADAGVNLIQGLINGISKMLSAAVNAITNVANAIRDAITKVWNGIKEKTSAIWSGIKTSLSNTWNGIKNTATNVWNGISNGVSNVWSGLKNSVVNGASEMWSNVTAKFEAIRSGISDKINSARDTVSNAIERIKGFFNFDWSLPHLKLPHLSITGSFSLVPPSVPSFSIQWYKKAMDNAMLLNGATIFGANGNTLLGGGEAGPEIVVGAQTLMNMIREANGGGGKDITINVYASPNHDEKKIAAEVERVLSASINRRRASSLA